ncbi:hypothetical protein H0H81_003995 [Sphagnurus paluster]|uniref:Uncharacterized protein n=1 Tax=Sphagnurus paluster TaxID=117069 RepID=A0A9P7K5E3_9AGAR|nr:hypothetical protein H0H81_003995 [Sphagnurus paluster]
MASFYPPPTSNKLDRHERMRLVRSNRKLEAVLGMAPYYLDPEESHLVFTPQVSKAHRREDHVYRPSPASSTSSLSSEEISADDSFLVMPKSTMPLPIVAKPIAKAKQLSRPLLLRLRSVPTTTSDTCGASLSPPLPSVAAQSPTSPTFTIDLNKLQATSLEHRRKKIAKLTRTLGENIPAELVFPQPQPERSSATQKPTRVRNYERKPIPQSFAAFPPPSPNTSASTPVISHPKPMSSSRSRTPATVTAPPPPSAPAQLLPIRKSNDGPTLAERRRKPRPRSLSLSTGTDALVAAARARARAGLEAVEAKPSGSAIAPMVSKEVVITRASLDFHSATADRAVTSIEEKATRDVLGGSRSPLPFQTIIPKPPHRYVRSSPSNPSEPAIYHHVKAASYSRPPLPMPMLRSVLPREAPSVFSRFGRRKEQGWSGEWNQDISDVVKRLRGLKSGV